jgi:metal-responsive CopG/Arc/MetJ family transcriptional regulator
MNHRLTIRLSRERVQQLDIAAKKARRTRSEIVRLALAQYLIAQSDARPVERVRDFLGSIYSGQPDLGQQHREHLIKRIHVTRR